jgi:hypothetical protein
MRLRGFLKEIIGLLTEKILLLEKKLQERLT